MESFLSKEKSEPVPPINVLQICDHLGWEGSRMHGVKRLFSWMIPRFDPNRFRVSLLSLRKRDLSEETLEQFGFPVHYLEKSRFDPSTLPALARLFEAPFDRRDPDPWLRGDDVRGGRRRCGCGFPTCCMSTRI